MSRRRRWIAVGVVVAVAGCAPPDDRETNTRGDSVALIEELRLDPDVEGFSTVSRIFVGRRGAIVVPLPQDRQIRWYDSTGKRIASVGRRGIGPGEFENVGAMGWKADTLWVFDARIRRVTYIAPPGTILRADAPLALGATPFTPMHGAFVQEISALSPDGSMLGTARRVTREGGELGLSPTFIARIAPGGSWDSLATPPVLEDPRWYMEVAGLGRYLPFGARPVVAHAADGSRFAFLSTEVTGPEGGNYTLSVFDADGDTVFTRSYPFTGVPIPRAAADSAVAAEARPAGSATEGPADLDRRFQHVARERMPPVYPPIQSLVLGGDDTIWLTLHDSAGVRRTLVLDRDGDPVGVVTMSTRSVIRQATASRVWVTETDADGLASVVRYRVMGIGAPPEK